MLRSRAERRSASKRDDPAAHLPCSSPFFRPLITNVDGGDLVQGDRRMNLAAIELQRVGSQA
jgi:hypothetical protein